MEYRCVSGTSNTPHFAAAVIPCPCRLFQLVAVPCSRFGKTFDPKVAGSIPARPMLELTRDGSVRVRARPRARGGTPPTWADLV